MSFKEIVEKIKKKRKENKERRASRRLKRRKYKSGSHHLKKDKTPVSDDSKPMPVKDKPVDEKPKDPVKEPEKKPEKPSELTGEDLDNMNEATLLRLLRAVADGIDKGVPMITFDGLLVPANNRVLEVAEERMHKLKGKGEAPKKEEPQKEAPKKEEPVKKVQDGGYDAGVKELAEAKAKTTPAKKV
tara:strand:- start:1626 stop:2186 length:561 start_codon:yes stop_codon:yes gene_type:complete